MARCIPMDVVNADDLAVMRVLTTAKRCVARLVGLQRQHAGCLRLPAARAGWTAQPQVYQLEWGVLT